MSVQKFKPLIWAKKFQEDLEMNSVFWEDCNHEHEGEATKPGDRIWIPGYGDVNTRRFSDGRLHDLGTPEEIESLGQFLEISEVSDFYFYLDNLDKRQAEGGSSLMSKTMDRARKNCNVDEDTFLASMVADDNIKVLDKTSAACTKSNILDFIDEALESLAENNVPRAEEIVITGCPKFSTRFKQAYITTDTDNSELLRTGRIGVYSKAVIKESNNVYITQGGSGSSTYDVYNIQVKTRNAISAVHPYFYTKAEEPSGKWYDAIKGYFIYGAKVTAPKEIINLQVKF